MKKILLIMSLSMCCAVSAAHVTCPALDTIHQVQFNEVKQVAPGYYTATAGSYLIDNVIWDISLSGLPTDSHEHLIPALISVDTPESKSPQPEYHHGFELMGCRYTASGNPMLTLIALPTTAFYG